MSGSALTGLVETGSPALADGTPVAATFTSSGCLRIASASSASYYHEWGGVGVDAAVVKASAGRVIGLDVSNDDAVSYWFMLFNLNVVPVNGEFPIYRRLLLPSTSPPGNIITASFPSNGISFGSGIGWAISTTGLNLTLPGGTPSVAVQVFYE